MEECLSAYSASRRTPEQLSAYDDRSCLLLLLFFFFLLFIRRRSFDSIIMAPSSGHQLIPKVWRVASRHSFVRQLERPQTGLRPSDRKLALSRLAAHQSAPPPGPLTSALRPNLTGGALCRTAGGYAIGAGRIGGARYFSSSPTSPAQVVQNVSVAMRSFWLSGQRARFDGIDKRTGAKKYKVVTVLQQEAGRKMDAIPATASGSYVDFKVSPTITALGCFKSMQKESSIAADEQATLNSAGLLDLLSGDFARVLMELAAVLNDLKKLATLGDLPISLQDQSTIRVRFPGCDAVTVEHLCIEAGVQRGVVGQDEDFESRNGADMALLFPFAPSYQHSESGSNLHDSALMRTPEYVNWQEMMFSNESISPFGTPEKDFSLMNLSEENPWARQPSAFSSVGISELGDREFFPDIRYPTPTASEYGGIEGAAEDIYSASSPLSIVKVTLVRKVGWVLRYSKPPIHQRSPDQLVLVSPEGFEQRRDLDYTSFWRDWFISSRGNEYFCEIDEEYLTDRFNLTGLNTEVQYYQYALDLVTDLFDLDADDDLREQIEKSARHLYGLVHARYIVTTRGLAKMLEKYKRADFGKCPRVMCDQHPLLPMGQSDLPGLKPVKLYCAKCEDIYNPKSSRHAAVDGAYFGSSFHNILFQVYPDLIPDKSRERYEPRVFGFKVHACAALARWQDRKQDELIGRLHMLDMESPFIEDRETEEEEEEEEEEEDEEDEAGDAVMKDEGAREPLPVPS
ncbi:casein kinase II subunit beta-2 [Arthroderma uncinatum]|uniref:casein kinase II subunit beta-2 n=1 Tax=Arthroderma uncinatum TaxID=74035 RepID=UPI00144A517B|nr:casein kinase II subunit beta-2 [Arthroderma uncinatum]KAF3481499.1 casein kinase II subunit beta-2 [Arthroderma uncinatum]